MILQKTGSFCRSFVQNFCRSHTLLQSGNYAQIFSATLKISMLQKIYRNSAESLHKPCRNST